MEKFNNLKLLYVEDEPSVRKYAMSYFRRIFQNTFEAQNGLEALSIFKKESPQVIITDIKMEGMSGIDLIKNIRQIDKKCQIIVLSAFLDTKYLLEAISLNLVKYLTKPIKPNELYSTLLQCADNLQINNNLIYFSNNSYFNTLNRSLIADKKEIKLSQKEIELLELLSLNNRTITYKEIENKIWYDSGMSDNALRLLVKKLRKKLPKNCLENIPKTGYKIKILK